MSNMITKSMVLYGAEWCHDCRRVKTFLDQKHIPYVFVDVEASEVALEKVNELNNGYQRIPVLVLPDGSIIVEPSDDELRERVTAA